MLVYTAIHEYTHHLVTVEKLAQNPAANCAGGCKVHTQEFWAKFGDLLAVAEQKGFYSIGWEVDFWHGDILFVAKLPLPSPPTDSFKKTVSSISK